MVLFLYIWLCLMQKCIAVGIQGHAPVLTVEPPRYVMFSNSSGTLVPCSAVGSPTPIINWVTRDGTRILQIPGLTRIRDDGALTFLPFPAENYRADLHAAVYRCVASNNFGAVSSGEVHLRAVVSQPFEIRLSDEYVIRGNMALLRCPIPNYVADHVIVTSWERTDGLLITPDTASGKYGMLDNGDLYFRYVTEQDGVENFRCHVESTVTNEKKSSINYAKLIITEPNHNHAPNIAIRSTKVVKFASHRAALSCIAHGYPPPVYRWLKKTPEGLRPPDFGRWMRQEAGVLVFPKVASSDSGLYVCLASNTMGEDRAEMRLLIEEPIEVSLIPKQVVTGLGKEVKLNCTISGSLDVRIEWMKDGQPLSSAEDRIILYRTANSIMELRQVKKKDSGVYQCFAHTASESVQAAAFVLTEDVSPKMISSFPDMLVSPGNFVSLKCMASGNPRFNWSLDGIWPLYMRRDMTISTNGDVAGNVISQLNITSVNTSLSGIYTCEAFNDAGKTSHSSRLNVFGPLTVRRLTNQLIALAGENFAFQCPFGGYPFETINWKKENRLLPEMQRQKVFPNGTLVISNVQRGKDDGQYQCQVTSRIGPSVSANFHIVVRTGPRVSVFRFEEDLREGMRTAVACVVSAGDKPFLLSWLKDGEALKDGQLDASIFYPEGGFVSTLTIDNLGYRHNGNYTCTATNDVATGSHSSVLMVKVPPQWVLKPEDTSAVSGGTARIDCQAHGLPQPHVRWKLTKSELPHEYSTIVSSSHVHILVNGSLNFRNVETGDAGSYLCEADNAVGPPITALIKLTVHSAPQFDMKFVSLTTRRGQRTVLECIPKAEKPVRFLWKKNGEMVDVADESRYSQTSDESRESFSTRLFISKAERQDSALFTCIASNEYGEDTTNIELIVQDIPDAPQNLDVHDVTSRSVRLTWSQPFDGNSPITNYTVAWRQLDENTAGGPLKIPGKETTATIRNLKPSVRYFFRVKCENILGSSQYSAEVAVTTLQEPPRIAALNVKAKAVSSRTVNVTWEFSLEESMSSSIDGFYVGYKVRGNVDAYTFIPIHSPDFSSPYMHAQINGLSRTMEYSIVVQAFNARGAGPASDETIVKTLEFDVPEIPIIRAHYATSSSIKLSWEQQIVPISPVSGYVLHHRLEGSSWYTTPVGAERTEHTLKSLRCGSRYQCYLIAFNSAGKSNASDVVNIKTEGNPPTAPDKRHLLTVNSSSATINLGSWKDGDCPILSFTIQYRSATGQKDWTLFSENILPAQRLLTIHGLRPATWYVLFLSARNEAGVTDAEYAFATLTLSGEHPPRPSEVSDSTSYTVYRHLTVTVPLLSFFLVLTLVLCTFCFVTRNRRFRSPATRAQEGSAQNDTSKPEQYPLSLTYEGEQPEALYFPSPYATARIQQVPPSHNAIPENRSFPQTRKQRESLATFGNNLTCTNYDVSYPVSRTKYETVYEPAVVYVPGYRREFRHCREPIYETPIDKKRPKSRSWNNSVHSSEDESDNDEPLHPLTKSSEAFRDEARESETECDRLWKAFEESHYESSKRLAGSHVILS